MNIAVVGCGNISRVHFDVISKTPDAVVVATVDTVYEKAKKWADAFSAKAYTSFDEMLANEKIDTVHICTPHYLHTQMAVRALEKGINVLTEKPCSMTLDEVEILRDAQKKTGKKVGVCFQNRYNDCSVYVKNVIDSGKMGKVLALRGFLTWKRDENYYSDDWHGTLEKEGGGVLINQAIHTIDLLQHFGGGCNGVTAHIANDHLKGVIEVEDTATALLTMKSGANAVLYATTAFVTDSRVLIDIKFEKGTLRMEGDRLFEITDTGVNEIGETVQKETVGKSCWGTGHAALIADFYDSIRNGRPFAIDAFSGGDAAKVVAACYESAKTNEKVII